MEDWNHKLYNSLSSSVDVWAPKVLVQLIVEYAKPFWDLEHAHCINTHTAASEKCFYSLIPLKGNILAAASDKNVSLWDLEHKLQSLEKQNNHSNSIYSIVQLADGKLASGSRDKTVKIWDLKTCACVKTFYGHEGPITALAVLPDNFLASASHDYMIRIWNVTNYSSESILIGHQYYVNCLAVLPNGNLVSGSNDKTVKIWDTKTASCIRTLRGHTDYINTLAIFLDGCILSGSDDKTMKIWNLQGQCIQTYKGNDYIFSCAILPDGNIGSGVGKNIHIWNPKTGDCLKVLKGHRANIFSLVVLPDGILASGASDHSLRIWLFDRPKRAQTDSDSDNII